MYNYVKVIIVNEPESILNIASYCRYKMFCHFLCYYDIEYDSLYVVPLSMYP